MVKVEFSNLGDFVNNRGNLKKSQISKVKGIDPSFTRFLNRPFYCWTEDCNKECFNHLIGLPIKDAKRLPLFEYERETYDSLQSNKHLWIKKATGLGITEFMLRYMAWLSVYDYTYQYRLLKCV